MFVSCWLVAEQLFDYEIEYVITNVESYIADIFYLAGYVFLFAFSIYYIRNMNIRIPKKIIVYACLISLLLFIPIFYINYENLQVGSFELILHFLYQE